MKTATDQRSPAFTAVGSNAARPALNGRTVTSIRGRSKAPPAMLAFLAALNDSQNVSDVPHPVHARNVRLVAAWQRWAALQEGVHGQSLADRVIAGPCYRYAQNVEAMEETIYADPIWKDGTLLGPAATDTLAMFATAPLMFWRRPHVLIELTPSLAHLLADSDLGGDIPVDQLRPPMPACYILFGEAMKQAIATPSEASVFNRIEGAYVFESKRDNRRAISVVAIYKIDVAVKLGVGFIELMIDDEKMPLNEVIRRAFDLPDKPGYLKHYDTIVQLCCKVFLYGNLEQARRIEESPFTDAIKQLDRVGPKKASKLRRQVERLYDRVLLGPLALPGHAQRQRGETATHWRRGHFRMQPHGPQMSLRKVIFIAPVLVRADRLHALPTQ